MCGVGVCLYTNRCYSCIQMRGFKKNWASNKEKIKELNGRAATCAAASALDGPAASIEPRRRGRRWQIIKNKRGWKAEAEKKNKTRGGEKTDLI